jgi:hypothetical protein
MKHQGLGLAGIIITYVFSVSIVAAMILSWVSWGWFEGYEIVLLLLGLITLVLVSLYHANIVKNRIIVGIFATLISVFGGVFILIGEKKQDLLDEKNIPSNFNELIETDDNSSFEKLKLLHKLFLAELITIDVFNNKKEHILSKLGVKSKKPTTQNLKMFNLLISIVWLLIFLISTIFSYIYDVFSAFILFYAFIIGIMIVFSMKKSKFLNILLQVAAPPLLIFFFFINNLNSGVGPIVVLFGFFQVMITFQNVITLTKKETINNNETDYKLIEKFKLLYDDKIISEIDLKIIIEKYL